MEILKGIAERAKRTGQEVASAAGDIAARADGLRSAAADKAAELVTDLRDATGESAVRTGHWVGDAVDATVWKVQRPVDVTLGTAKRVISDTFESAGLTMIVGAFFPPAVPFFVGLDLLMAPTIFGEALNEASAEVDARRAERVRQRSEELDRKLAGWRKLPAQVTTESEHIRVVIDTASGTADGVILSGDYAGRALSTIGTTDLEHLRDTAPDDETRQILAAWLSRSTAVATRVDKQQALTTAQASKPRKLPGI